VQVFDIDEVRELSAQSVMLRIYGEKVATPSKA
jgi:hypothetical protein